MRLRGGMAEAHIQPKVQAIFVRDIRVELGKQDLRPKALSRMSAAVLEGVAMVRGCLKGEGLEMYSSATRFWGMTGWGANFMAYRSNKWVRRQREAGRGRSYRGAADTSRGDVGR